MRFWIENLKGLGVGAICTWRDKITILELFFYFSC